jgi:hypothetical protein
VPKDSVRHCTAKAVLGGHDLGEWQQIEGPRIIGYQARCKRCKKATYASRLAVNRVLADVCPRNGGDDPSRLGLGKQWSGC